MAKHFTYFDPKWRTEPFTCPKCGWVGLASSMVRELHEALGDFSCPRCDAMLLITAWPTDAEVKAAAVAGNVEAKEMLVGVQAAEATKTRQRLPPRTAQQKASATAKWARIMAKWLITYSRRRGAKWQLVEFGGPTGAESRGIVDLLAVRKDHRDAVRGTKRGEVDPVSWTV